MPGLRQPQLLRRQARRLLRPKPAGRRIILHIGAHKTGTTYIQNTLRANRTRLPLKFETVPRKDPDLDQITLMVAAMRSAAEVDAATADLSALAQAIGHKFRRVQSLLITHEGLPGPLPGNRRVSGLYPFAHLILPPIIKGLRHSGAEVSVVLYTRRFRDWQASLYRYRFSDQPGRGYNPDRFAARTGLPGGWQDLLARLRTALGEVPFHVVSYEKDRRSGLLGQALYRHMGLSDSDITRLRRLPPVNVSRPHTKSDRQFQQ